MNAVIIIIFSLMAFVCFCGILAEKDTKTKSYMTLCFAICAILVFGVYVLGGAV